MHNQDRLDRGQLRDSFSAFSNSLRRRHILRPLDGKPAPYPKEMKIINVTTNRDAHGDSFNYFAQIVVLLLSITPVSALHAETEISLPPEDQLYKYYVGVADRVESLKEGLDEAFGHAAEQAIAENFGVATELSSESYSTSTSDQILRRFRVKSGNIFLKGLERVRSSYQEIGNSNKLRVIAIYRYSRAAISEEKSRILHGTISTPEFPHSNIGNQSSEFLGGLSVVTDPPLAKIWLNEMPYLKSPITIKNQIEPGIYKLLIDHPSYENIDEDIIIRANEITQIKKTLKPAKGYMRITSNPSGAKVLVDGKIIGVTPIEKFSYPAGQKFQIDLIHKDALKSTTHDLLVYKDQTKNQHIEMIQKDSFLKLNCPVDSRIEIDGIDRSGESNEIQLSAGNHQILVTKPGFQAWQKSISLSPNEKKEITIVLKPEEKKESNWEGTLSKDVNRREDGYWKYKEFFKKSGISIPEIYLFAHAELTGSFLDGNYVYPNNNKLSVDKSMAMGLSLEAAVFMKEDFILTASRTSFQGGNGQLRDESDLAFQSGTRTQFSIHFGTGKIERNAQGYLSLDFSSLDAVVQYQRLNSKGEKIGTFRRTHALKGLGASFSILEKRSTHPYSFRLGLSRYEMIDYRPEGHWVLYFSFGLGQRLWSNNP